MSRVWGIIAGLASITVLFCAEASAQTESSEKIGNATVTVGSGVAVLDLPDIQFTKFVNSGAPGSVVTGSFTNARDLSSEVGWNINGSVSVPNGAGRTVSLRGFWANVDERSRVSCTSQTGRLCSVNPLVPGAAIFSFAAIAPISGDQGFTTRTDRHVDQTGLSVESKRVIAGDGASNDALSPGHRFLAFGADWRTIMQTVDIRHTFPSISTTSAFAMYNEELDTRYIGAYAAWGGDLFASSAHRIWEQWGLRTSFRLQGGLYHAHSDYAGQLRAGSALALALNSSATDTDDAAAFIGGLSLETAKRIGRRATLSLKGDYEYYSYVPSMNYNDQITGILSGPNVGTTIDGDDGHAMRASLRLTVGLGPRSLY